MAQASDILSSLRSEVDIHDYRKLHWEGSFEDYLGLVIEKPETTRTAYQRLYDMILTHGTEDIYELSYIRKDGSRFPAIVSVTALRDAQENIIGYLLIGTDNTARKQVEEEQKRLDQRLRDQQFYTRSLIESNIDALMMADPLGIITDVNKQMEALTGCTRDELIGAPFKNYFTDPERAEAAIKLMLSQKKVTNYELTARSRDGKETVVSYNATTFYDRDRRLQGVFAAARDVTERQRLDQVLVGPERTVAVFEHAHAGQAYLRDAAILLPRVAQEVHVAITAHQHYIPHAHGKGPVHLLRLRHVGDKIGLKRLAHRPACNDHGAAHGAHKVHDGLEERGFAAAVHPDESADGAAGEPEGGVAQGHRSVGIADCDVVDLQLDWPGGAHGLVRPRTIVCALYSIIRR